MAQDILTAVEVAVELRISKAHVYHLFAGTVAGVLPLPHIRMGRRMLVRRGALEHWKLINESNPLGDRMPPSAVNTVERMEKTNA
jgi:hypothetical protein